MYWLETLSFSTGRNFESNAKIITSEQPKARVEAEPSAGGGGRSTLSSALPAATGQELLRPAVPSHTEISLQTHPALQEGDT